MIRLMWRISGPRIWRCVNPHCNRSYKNKFHLTYHLKYECGKQPLYKCNFCQRMFSRNSNMKKHMFTVHKYISPWFKQYLVKMFNDRYVYLLYVIFLYVIAVLRCKSSTFTFQIVLYTSGDLYIYFKFKQMRYEYKQIC